ncbi:MAG: galactokinase, partial [Chloroflexi bacterium]|nr:galactokinase [Chloroflexota bacterium]
VGVNSGIMDQYASLLCREGAALLIDCRSLEARLVPLDLEGGGLRLLVCDTRVERGLASTGYNERRASCERAARALGVEQLRDATMADLDRLQGEDLKRARHVMSENQRVLDAVAALEGRDFVRFGRLMVLSHLSLRDDYKVSTPELDTFVDVALETGAVGARLTGAGFGGCAIALIPTDREESLVDACRGRFRECGFKAPLFYGVSPASGAEVVARP